MTDAVLVVLTAISIVALQYVVGYFRGKGQNAATKDDIDELTQRVESIKRESAEGLERVKATIASRLGISQYRYQREYDLLAELASLVVTLRDVTVALYGNLYDPIQPGADPDADKTKVRSCEAAASALLVFTASRSPFLPPTVDAAVKSLAASAMVQRFGFEIASAITGARKDTQGSLNDRREIYNLVAAVMKAIETRVREWETFEAPTSP